MKVGVFGGTGELGSGLALRLSRRHDVVIGSRDAERARSFAGELSRLASAKTGGIVAGSLTGASNNETVKECDVMVFAVPASKVEEFLGEAASFSWKGQLVVSPVTRFEKEGGAFFYKPFQVGDQAVSAAELVQARLGENARVVSGLHCVPAARLGDLDDPLGFDVPLAGPREAALSIAQLIEGVGGLRPLYAGPLSVSASLEALTPLLLNIAVRNRLKEPGFRVVA